jgi:hypothetical protein
MQTCHQHTISLRNKGTDLVELEVVQELVQLPVLLLLLELEVVLLETVEGQLGLVIDVNLEWLLSALNT